MKKSVLIFMPFIEGGGAEKNLFLISNFLIKKIREITIITISKKYKKKFNKSIKFVTLSFDIWGKFGKKFQYFLALILLIKEILNNKNLIVFSFQANIYCIVICKLFGVKVISRSNTAPIGWSKNWFKRNIFRIILNLADKNKIKLDNIYTGMSEIGPDLGSESVKLVRKRKVAIISGEDSSNMVSSLNYGAIWHFFEQELKYPLTHLNIENFEDIELDEFDTLIIPSGYYGTLGNEKNLEKIKLWISKGGNLIAFENAIRIFTNKDGFSVKVKRNETERNKDVKFEDLRRERVQNYLSGAIFKVNIDNTHPLAYGYENEYYSLKTSSSTYEKLKRGFNVGKIDDDENSTIGFVGNKIKENFKNSLVFGHERIGRGNVIYFADNILFRNFWENGKLFLVNSIFYIN